MKDIVKALNDLVQLDFDASKTYEQAIDHCDDELVKSDLRSFMQDHVRHIADLTAAIVDLGGQPIEPKRDVKGVVLESMTRLRAVTGTSGALKAMRMNEKLTNRSYDKAAELSVPPRIREILLANLDDERRHLAAIEAHIARLTGKRADRVGDRPHFHA